MGFQAWGKDELNKVTEELKKIPAGKRSTVRNSIKDLNTASEALAVVRTVSALISNISESPGNASEMLSRASEGVSIDNSANNLISDENTLKTPVNALERVNDAGGLDMSEIENKINALIDNFLEINNIEDLTKEPQRRFSALSTYIGKHLFKGTKLLKSDKLIDNNSARKTTCNAYDLDKVAAVLNYYVYICQYYNKAFTLDAAAAFCGLSDNYITENRDKLTLRGFDPRKKSEESIATGILDGKGVSPVGSIAYLNNRFGWSQGTQSHETKTQTTIIYPVLIEGKQNKIGVASGET